MDSENKHMDEMAHTPNQNEWRSIQFEGVELPSSLMAISILISVDAISERTGDWIWRLVHCKGAEKSGDMLWCHDSATELVDYLIECRASVLRLICERLRSHGFNPETTFVEWVRGLAMIREIVSEQEGQCHWIAEVPGFNEEKSLERANRFLDLFDPDR